MIRWLVAVVLVLGLLITGCSSLDGFGPRKPLPQALPETSSECIQDGDCVPASCCHADSCVPKAEKPVCAGLFCTMDCQPGTLDCGQGRCGCVKGSCKAVLGGAP